MHPSPTGFLHGQALAEVLHSGAERQLAGVQAIKALRQLVHAICDHAEDVLEGGTPPAIA
ncbi:MAG TPA: hypothetical protein VN736_09225 [Candidatus Limnocylindrales bacterium]|nr:hypothetical protein [Candidatus Limnocylindrales bacterium]